MDQEIVLGVARSTRGLLAPQPDSHVAEGLGMATYVSVPVITIAHGLHGTLCGASRGATAVADTTVASMQSFAALLSDFMALEAMEAVRKQVAAMERRFDDQSRFLADSEHKLKTHLAVISGWATTLSEEGYRLSSAERSVGLEVIRTQGDKLGLELQRMLEEAKSEIRPHELEPVDLDLVELVTSSAATLDAAAPHHTVRCSGAESVHALADPAVLYQVLAHLIDNAVKYSPRGSTVQVWVGASGDWAVIEVQDEGIGIPEGMDLFAAFKRGAGDEVQATHGVGLGLHIVRSLVQAMGGLIAARRNADAGSTFTILLPMAASPADAQAIT